MAKLTKRQQAIKEFTTKFAGKQNAEAVIEALQNFIKESGSKNTNQTIEFSAKLGIDTKVNDQQVLLVTLQLVLVKK